jgi:hypothetical protein
MVSSWTEYLCLERADEENYTLSVRGYEVLGELSDFYDEEIGDHRIPSAINGSEVVRCEDGYVLGGKLSITNDALPPFHFKVLGPTHMPNWLTQVARWDVSVVQKVYDAIRVEG